MHIARVKQKKVVGLIKHIVREHIAKNVDKERLKDDVFYFNEDLDFNDNINKKYNKSYNIKKYIYDTIQERTKRKVREDQNVLGSLIIHQPKDMPNTDGLPYNKEFFDTMVNVIQNYEFGKRKIFPKKNFVCASIHCDETQPHMHYVFLPIYDNDKVRKKKNENKKTDKIYKRNENERLNFDFMSETFLKFFHKNFENESGYKLTLNDNEKRNLSMPEYQKQQELKKQNEKIHEEIKQLEKQIEEKKTNKTELETELKKENDTLKIENEKLKNEIQKKHDIINHYDYNYKHFNNFNIEPPKEEKKILMQPQNQMLIDRQKQEQFIKQVNELIFATHNDYDKRHTLKEQLDKEIAEKEKYLEHIKDKDYCDLKATINEKDITISKLRNDVSNAEMKTKNINTLYEDTKQKLSNWQGSYRLLEKENDTIKSILDKNDILDKVMGMVQKIMNNGKDYTQ